ncbi:transmembrane protein 177 [Maniola hyperantus]|uniref:transmembrane protein 177 n=1 Tax=Aphantopus hyperantus TaxID=2795564 RepID=UPI0015680745|nr:transmembrane protein 177 [Maniola hyperantus]
MSVKRPVSWFLTEQGRRFSFSVITGTGLALTAARFTPHTFFLQKYKDFVHYYNEGKPVELPNDLNNMFQKCLDLLNISETHRKLIEPFSVFGFDLFHAGSTNSRFGVVVGIPVNFTYKTLDDVGKQNLQVNQKSIDLKSEIGKKLGEALILSDKVKEFAMCREILMTHNYKVMLESSYPFICLFFAYNLSHYINIRLNLFRAPQSIRGVLYSIIGFFSVGTYFLMKDMTEVYYETAADKKLCELGPDYINSGVIFYDKLLQRNQALRELMGKEGEKKYTITGNENHMIRQPRVALIHRKQYFEQRLKQSNEDFNEHNITENYVF